MLAAEVFTYLLQDPSGVGGMQVVTVLIRLHTPHPLSLPGIPSDICLPPFCVLRRRRHRHQHSFRLAERICLLEHTARRWGGWWVKGVTKFIAEAFVEDY